MTASATCLRLFVHCVRRAASRAAWTAGRSKAMRMPMIAMTTNNSISVKPGRGRERLGDMEAFFVRRIGAGGHGTLSRPVSGVNAADTPRGPFDRLGRSSASALEFALGDLNNHRTRKRPGEEIGAL